MTGSIYDWSVTPADNDDSDSAYVNWAEFMTPDGVNDSGRGMMARIAEFIADVAPKRSSTGAANSYAITVASSPTALVNGMIVGFIAHQANAGASTLNVNSLGATPLRSRSNTALQSGEIQSGQAIIATYNSTIGEFLIQNGSPQLYALYSTLLGGNVFGIKVGDVKLSLSSSPDAGFVRLTDTTQTLNKADYPELNAWASAQSYPWGSASTTFNIPPAGGYFLRFGASGSTIDPSGPRTAGSTQADAIASHTHGPGTLAGTTSTDGAHSHTVTGAAGAEGGSSGSSLASATTRTTSTGGAHSHTVTISSGLTDATGTTETRPKNVAMFADMLAKPALVANDLIGVAGYYFKFATATSDADPGAGFIAVNNSDLSQATTAYISKTDAFGSSAAATIASWTASTSSVKGTLKLQKVGAPGTWRSYRVSSASVDATTYYKLTLTHLSGSGTLSASDRLSIQFFEIGDSGSAGPNTGYAFKWSTGTTDADPGSGYVRANNASPASATYLYVSKLSADGASLATRIAEWGASTSTVKGTIRLFSVSNAGNEINYRITGAAVDATTYYKIPVSDGEVTGSLSADAVLAASVTRTGDAGNNGVGSGTVTSIGLTMPAEFSVGSSPVTSSGTIAVTKANQNANIVYAGPSSGSPAAPTFRALVSSDLPTSGVSAGTYDSVTVSDRGVVTAGTNPSLGSDGTYRQASVTLFGGKITGIAAGTLPTVQKFTYTGSAQTWNRPSGCRAIRYTAIGGGGQGGGATLAAIGAGGGGGSGAEAEGWLDVTSISSLTITVGNGGSTGAAGAAGEDGGATSIANGVTNIVTCPGGKGGALGTSAATVLFYLAAGGAGGAAVTGSVYFSANTGAAGGYASRPTASAALSGAGASTRFGGGGAALYRTTAAGMTNTIGNAATGFGAGGSGCVQINTTNNSTHKGGNGAPGFVIIEEFY